MKYQHPYTNRIYIVSFSIVWFLVLVLATTIPFLSPIPHYYVYILLMPSDMHGLHHSMPLLFSLVLSIHIVEFSIQPSSSYSFSMVNSSIFTLTLSWVSIFCFFQFIERFLYFTYPSCSSFIYFNNPYFSPFVMVNLFFNDTLLNPNYLSSN